MTLKLLIPTILLLFCLVLVLPVYAQDEVDLSDFPANLASQLGIDSFSAGILASMIVVLLFLLPTLLLTRNGNAHLLVGGGAFAFSIAMGWMPVWLFAVIIMLIAFGFARMMSKQIGG